MFGSNNWGQLGFGTKATVAKPTCVKALKTEKVKLAACGRNHTLVYTTQGNVYVTGGNSEGQLGLGDYDERSTFQLVDFFNKRGPIKMLAAGSNTSAALTQSGVLYVWGDNSEGQIGLGKESNAVKPHKLSVGRPVSCVACGYYHSALVTVDGELYTFGERDSGKLGLPTNKLANHRVPQLVDGIKERVLQVACGGGHTVALTEDCLYTFGLGQFGQLGHGTFIFESRSPRAVEHFRKGRVQHVACGENHTAVVTDCGLLYAFGDGRHGKLGLGEENFTNQFKPTLCPRFLKYHVETVTCGGCHMLVFAKSRSKAEQEVTLEEDDVTEDFWEKPYTELLGDTVGSATLQRSLSARVRRRERERSPEQFGVMFRTLPPLSSTHPGATILPVPSQTLPPRLHLTDLQDRNDRNDLNRGRAKKSGLSTRIGKVKKSKAKKGSPAEAGDDSESVKDLGETTDILNVTHMMKMDPSDQSLTLSPVHKDGAGEASQVTNQDGAEDEDENDEGVEEMEGSEEEEDKDEEKEEVEDQLIDEVDSEPDETPNTSSPQEAEVEKEKEVAVSDGEVKEKEVTVPDGVVKETEEKMESQSQKEEVLESSTPPQTKEEKPRGIFGPNRRGSLFQRQPPSRRQDSKEEVEGLSESTSTGKPIAEGSSTSDQSVGDAGRCIASETQQGKKAPTASRSRSATCVLL
ncbi:retinitis pigmentosa GTPase regulator b isoform X2 [Sardina pilchardus]